MTSTSAPCHPLPAPPATLAEGCGLPEWRATSPGASEQAWRSGYLWARAGRHDLAWRWWRRAAGRATAATVQVSRAATLRQIGLHGRALIEDLAGLHLAGPGTDRVAAAALRVGLVADAVGTGRLPDARARLAEAAQAVDALPTSSAADRQRIRLDWVTAEVALLAGEQASTALLDRLPEVIRGTMHAPDTYAAGSRHHLAKGLLFTGVLSRRLEPLDVAASLAPEGLRWAVHLARRDLGAEDAEDAARQAYRHVVPPPHVARAVPAELPV